MINVDAFSHLRADQVDRILGLGERRMVSAGTLLGHADGPVTSFYIILSGQAELSYGSQSWEMAIRLAGPGETFPWAGLGSTGNLVTNCRARIDMEVLDIPIDDLTALFHRDPEIGMGFYRGVMELFAGQYRRTLAMLAANVERELTGLR